jgi:23S rRNA (adenine2503-C2)-methyltransferase
LKVVAASGRPDLATAYVAAFEDDKLAEFVEAVQPPYPIGEKWVLIVSSLFGCPVACRMCDAGGYYRGKMSAAEIFSQIDFLVERRYPSREVPAKKFKIQFARVGEPALNGAVLDVLEGLPGRYDAPGLMPAVSTVAPAGADDFFERLRAVKSRYYSGGRFQLQFSIHTTDEGMRDRLVPVRKWPVARVAAYGESFFEPGDRKITLNFALAEGAPLDAGRLARTFDPEKFLVKLTPLNPTYTARRNGLRSHIEASAAAGEGRIVEDLRAEGFDVILSIGEPEENLIGSNCGQFLRARLAAREELPDGYTYPVEAFSAEG